MKLILEKWQKFIKENQFSSDVPDFRDTFDNMNQRQYAAMERRYGRDLKKVGLDFEDYKRFSQVMMVKRDKYIPIEKFIENMKNPDLKQKMIEIDPGLDKTKADQDQGQKFSSAPSKQRVEKMYNALRQMDGQMSGEKYEKAVAALNDLLRSL
tara:strand:+ start:408 stop:866 length:459 start_codon:yes stop_codon:yes gene_type:complete